MPHVGQRHLYRVYLFYIYIYNYIYIIYKFINVNVKIFSNAVLVKVNIEFILKYTTFLFTSFRIHFLKS